MNNFIYAIGLIGQGLFTGRMLVQWIASEKAKTSVVPFSYWILSILGSLLLLVYAVIRKDPIFIMGQAFGLVVYLRNIHMLKVAVVRDNVS